MCEMLLLLYEIIDEMISIGSTVIQEEWETPHSSYTHRVRRITLQRKEKNITFRSRYEKKHTPLG